MSEATGNVLPDIVVGGSPRSGTTFLAEVLGKHPDVFVARPLIPEPKVLFSDPRHGDEAVWLRYADLFSHAPPGAITVEKTSNYFESSFALERFRRLLPRTRLIVMLRDPVQRAYSNWKWSRKNGLENLTFAEAVDLENNRVDPFGGARPHVRPFDYLTRSRYGSLAVAWIEAIGRDRICFLTMEEALADPERFVAVVQDFVGVPPLRWQKLSTGVVNATEKQDEIDPALAIALRDRLRNDMDILHRSTGIAVQQWGFGT